MFSPQDMKYQNYLKKLYKNKILQINNKSAIKWYPGKGKIRRGSWAAMITWASHNKHLQKKCCTECIFSEKSLLSFSFDQK